MLVFNEEQLSLSLSLSLSLCLSLCGCEGLRKTVRRSNARYPRLPSSTHRACNESEEEQVEERIVEHDVMTMERHRTGTRHRRDALGDESQSRASASAFTLRLAKGSWVTSALVVLNAIVCVTLLVTYIDVESLKSVDYRNTLGTLVERLLKLGSEGDGIASFDFKQRLDRIDMERVIRVPTPNAWDDRELSGTTNIHTYTHTRARASTDECHGLLYFCRVSVASRASGS